ncbi:MAG TPA: hypothetical protein VGM54_13340 [Chthoniobacter sp.]
MSLTDRQEHVDPKHAAEDILGTINWQDDHKGYCTCPGEDIHRGKTGKADCIVYLDGAANIFCFHQSCVQERQEAARQLRAAIASGDFDGGSKVPARELKERKRRELQRLALEVRASFSLRTILKRYPWSYEEIKKDTPSAYSAVADHWKDLLGLFKPGDVVWVGNTYDSGSSQHHAHFRTIEGWFNECRVLGQFTCPAVFKNASFSRSNDNVLHRRFLVVESDVLSKDQVGAIFRFLKEEVGLHLRAVVDSAGKSLHGWFDFPKKAVLEELEIILPHLGCDPGLFRASQPCRMPGALRDGKYQQLIYLDKDAGGGGVAKMPSTVLPLPEVYYDGIGTSYWRANDSGGWHKINESSLETELLAQGYGKEASGNELLSPIQRAKRDIQIKQDVVYAGPLAGCHQGVHEILGQRVLVTQSPKLIEPRAGDWSTLRQLIENLFKNEMVDQTPYVYGWFKCADQSLRSGKHTPGQCLAIAGPPDAGKSLIQNLSTVILGGRAAKPYLFMTGNTPFNSELFGAEHLMIEDESASKDIRARGVLGAFIKMITVNRTQSCHPKNRPAFTLTPWWRLTISVNEEPEHLMVLPPLDDSLRDKIILLQAFKKPFPMPNGTTEEKEAFWKQLVSEIPAFLDFLSHWEIPVALRNNRFGIATYHNPTLIAALGELQPEIRLLNIIDGSHTTIRAGHDWEGTAVELQRDLTDKDAKMLYEARQLLSWPNACGTYLGRLAKQFPERVTSRVVSGKTYWRIEPTLSGEEELTTNNGVVR